jgi:hypothetical protein
MAVSSYRTWCNLTDISERQISWPLNEGSAGISRDEQETSAACLTPPPQLVATSQDYLPRNSQSAPYRVLHEYSTNCIVSFRVVCQLNMLLVVSKRVNMQCFFPSELRHIFFFRKTFELFTVNLLLCRVCMYGLTQT